MGIIDTRELEAELNELEARRNDEDLADPLDEDETDRLNALIELRNEVGSEFRYGATMVPAGDFTEYAQELAEEIGAIPDGNNWPLHCIDWEWAARELKMDYQLITFDGDDYYVHLYG